MVKVPSRRYKAVRPQGKVTSSCRCNIEGEEGTHAHCITSKHTVQSAVWSPYDTPQGSLQPSLSIGKVGMYLVLESKVK